MWPNWCYPIVTRPRRPSVSPTVTHQVTSHFNVIIITSHRNLSSYPLCPYCYQHAVTHLVLYPHGFILPSHCNPSSSPTVALIVSIYQLLLSSLSSIVYLFEYYCFPCIMMNLSFLIQLTISFFPSHSYSTSTYILFQLTSYFFMMSSCNYTFVHSLGMLRDPTN